MEADWAPRTDTNDAEKEMSLVPTQTQIPDHSVISLVVLPTSSLYPWEAQLIYGN